MKIAIAGTRGIPNNYGGFEQCAEYLSVLLTEMGHEVIVYNSHYHPYQKAEFKGVQIVKCYNPENKIGTAGNFIYDLLCMRHAIREKADVLLMLGYTTASVFYPFLNFKKTILVTNMDGLEWKRDKWNNAVKKLAKWFEKLGAKYSPFLVADNPRIQEYLWETYQKESTCIAYGCEPFLNPDESVLKNYGVTAGNYGMLIARMEAENNIEMILDGFAASKLSCPFLVIGNLTTEYGKRLAIKFKNDSRIIFKGGIYNFNHLNNLRYFSRYYFHGHTVGGTNPSLLEAMASGAYIYAHQNGFNSSVLGSDASYFDSAAAITTLLEGSPITDQKRAAAIQNNLQKVNEIYTWPVIAGQYEALCRKVVG
ncbi:MAG: DUF1972 domain-containing protein [Bacteroidia bacterium]|nr:DUF1972 domain-containing protein [Bacteroidia bacterium]